MGSPGRPKSPDPMDVLAVRMPDDLVSEIDEYIAAIKREFPLLNVSRADAVRQLIAAGIAAEKARLAKRRS
jgi:metal-responsive CopG/Arc/MetJ family transcriptional regulator